MTTKHERFELTFVTDPLTEDQELDLIDNEDAFAGRRGAYGFVTIAEDGLHALAAAQNACYRLQERHIRVRRAQPELVNQTQIADRVGVSKQAVHKWILNGLRHTPFPDEYAWIEGPVWAWEYVNDWLKKVRANGADENRYPTPAEIDDINAWLSNGQRPATPGYLPNTGARRQMSAASAKPPVQIAWGSSPTLGKASQMVVMQ